MAECTQNTYDRVKDPETGYLYYVKVTEVEGEKKELEVSEECCRGDVFGEGVIYNNGRCWVSSSYCECEDIRLVDGELSVYYGCVTGELTTDIPERCCDPDLLGEDVFYKDGRCYPVDRFCDTENFQIVENPETGDEYYVDSQGDSIPQECCKQSLLGSAVVYEENRCILVGCEDANEFKFKDDGTVVGLIDTTTGKQEVQLTKDCCETLGYTYKDTKCYYSPFEICEREEPFKIVMGANQQSGAFFEVDEEEDCKLQVEFDYMFQYDCDTLRDCINSGTDSSLDNIFSLDVSVNLEKDVTQQQNSSLETVYTEKLYDVNNPVEYLRQSGDTTGIIFTGSNCDLLRDQIREELGEDCDLINKNPFDSGWLHKEIIFADPSILSQIENEELKLSFTINDCNCDFSILIDNIDFNRKCTITERDQIFINECPGFDLKRVEDNKKSWVSNESEVDRRFDFKDRYTEYEADHHKLVINSKEIDLNVDIGRGVETTIMDYAKSNPCIFSGDVQEFDCTKSGCTAATVDISSKMDTPVSSFTEVNKFVEEINSKLIDVKTRKTLNAYPLLEAVYNRYKYSEDFCGIATNKKLDYDDMMDFSELLGNYWIDLVEQVMPATAMWDSTYVYGNSVFHSHKFEYPSYSLFTYCGDNVNQLSGDTDIFAKDGSVNAKQINLTESEVSINNNDGQDSSDQNPCKIETKSISNCGGVFINNFDDGTEFVGTYTIVDLDFDVDVDVDVDQDSIQQGSDTIAVTEP